LSETALGHTRLIDVLKDPRLHHACAVEETGGHVLVKRAKRGDLPPSASPPGVWGMPPERTAEASHRHRSQAYTRKTCASPDFSGEGSNWGVASPLQATVPEGAGVSLGLCSSPRKVIPSEHFYRTAFAPRLVSVFDSQPCWVTAAALRPQREICGDCTLGCSGTDLRPAIAQISLSDVLPLKVTRCKCASESDTTECSHDSARSSVCNETEDLELAPDISSCAGGEIGERSSQSPAAVKLESTIPLPQRLITSQRLIASTYRG